MSRLVSYLVASSLFLSFPAKSEVSTPNYIMSFGDIMSKIDNLSERCPKIRLEVAQNSISLDEFKSRVISAMGDSTEKEKIFYLFSFSINLAEAEQYCPLYRGFSMGTDHPKEMYRVDSHTQYWG